MVRLERCHPEISADSNHHAVRRRPDSEASADGGCDAVGSRKGPPPAANSTPPTPDGELKQSQPTDTDIKSSNFIMTTSKKP